MKNPLHEIALSWLDAFNTKNIDQLLDLYHDEAQHFSPRLLKMHPETNGLIVGKKLMREWWLDAFNRMPDLNYQKNHIVAEDNIIYIEYIRCTKNETDLIVNEQLVIKDNLIISSKVL